MFITDHGRPAFALLTIDDCYRIAGQSKPSLLYVMDGIPSGDAVKYDPVPLNLQIESASFD